MFFSKFYIHYSEEMTALKGSMKNGAFKCSVLDLSHVHGGQKLTWYQNAMLV